ncbi:monovalent cation/H(+) antiporter subunit G [Yinghuangia aomiensis]
MNGRHIAALALLTAGSVVLVLAAAAMLRLPGPHARIHALSAAGSVGAPLAVLAAAVETGPGRAAAKLGVIALLLLVGGTIATMAIGRLNALLDEPRHAEPRT